MSTPKQERARIVGQINSMYTNISQFVTPKVNQIEFEKAINEDKTLVFLETMFKGYADQVMSEYESETDELKKSEIISNSKKQLSRLSKIDVVFNSVIKSVWVDSIDTETNTYKDNSINKILNRVGKTI